MKLEKFLERSKAEIEFWDKCDRTRNEKKAFIKAVRRTFKNPVELRANFVVETNERLLYAYSTMTDSFYLLETKQA